MNGVVQGRTALVLYGTETGTAQDLAEELGRVTERLRFPTRIAELDEVPITLLSSYTVTIFVISTTGQGEFPSNAKHFWNSLLKKKLPATYLQHVSFFLVGLGDSSYPKFNWAARKLGKRLKQLGATQVIPSCEADEQGEDGTEGAFLAWLPLFRTALLEGFPIPHGLEPIPDEQPLPSKWILGYAPETADANVSTPSGTFRNAGRVENPRRINGEIPIVGVDDDARPIPGAFQVFLEQNRRVTPLSHWQDVRLLTLTTKESINYLPGDALSIMPKNFPEDVKTLINLMGWSTMADLPIAFIHPSGCADLTTYPACPIPYLSPSSNTITLRTLLICYLDITCIPRRSAFATLSRYTTNPTHRERLLEFTLPPYLDEYYDYATRPRRSILEILQEFDSVKIPWQEAASVFPVLRGRQFSIASGGNLRRISGDLGGGTKFEILVAIVKYQTVIKKVRQGVCTRYLAALAPGSTLNVVLRTEGRFTATKQKQMRMGRDFAGQDNEEMTPKLLIGAGTGIAPLRALIQEDEETVRRRGGEKNARSPPTALFFGSRNRDKDFFFADEWAAKLAGSAEKNGRAGGRSVGEEQEGGEGFKLITAFSRDQSQKIYLQDRLREQAELVFDLLVKRKATVVVCGSSGAMPKAVRQALVDVLVQRKDGREVKGSGAGNSVVVKEEEEEEESKEVEEKQEHGASDTVSRKGWTQAEAERYLDAMEKERRYLQETW